MRLLVFVAIVWMGSSACGGAEASRTSTGDGLGRGRATARVSLALGTETACVVDEHQGATCFGRHASEIAALGPMAHIAIGDGVGCAVTVARRLYCWGLDGLAPAPECFAGLDVVFPDPLPPNTPEALSASCPLREVTLGADVDHVWVGSTVGCARLATGEMRCWGGQVIELLAPSGGAPTRPRRVRALETPLGGVASDALALADDHGCLLDADRGVRCFGDDTQGQLGDGSSEPQSEPTRVEGLSSIEVVRVAEGRSCALDVEGRVSCWGNRGLDNPEIDRRPARIESPEPLSTLAVSRLSGCGLARRGGVLCWGATFRGRLGIESDSAVRALVAIPAFADADDVGTGIMYTCAHGAQGLVCTGEAPTAAATDLGPRFVSASPAPETPSATLPADIETSCTADADCLLAGPGCCEPCDGWPVSALSAIHRNATEAHRAHACPEPMMCVQCAAPAPAAEARCVEHVCRVIAR